MRSSAWRQRLAMGVGGYGLADTSMHREASPDRSRFTERTHAGGTLVDRVDLTTFDIENWEHKEIAAVFINYFLREFDEFGQYFGDVDSPEGREYLSRFPPEYRRVIESRTGEELEALRLPLATAAGVAAAVSTALMDYHANPDSYGSGSYRPLSPRFFLATTSSASCIPDF